MYRTWVFIVASVLLATGCILIASPVTVPHANYKIAVSKEFGKAGTLEVIDHVLTNLGFTLLENDWREWEPLLEKEQLAEKKQERRYRKGKFELFYGVMYLADTPEFIRLDFYENESRRFTDLGVKLYHEIHSAFTANGLVHLEETTDNVNLSRPIVTPEQFNAAHPPLSITENLKTVSGYVVSVAIYVVIILLPSWLLLKKLLSKRISTVLAKRSVMTAVPSFTLFPMPIPLSIVGPSLLAPGILFMPMINEMPESYGLFALSSILGTLAVSALASFLLIK